jgi:hypothetical protein
VRCIVVGLIGQELTFVLAAYALAAIPIGAILAAGKLKPLCSQPSDLCRWWSRFALLIVAFALALSAAGIVA